MCFQPRHAYLTHYSQIGNLARHAQSLHELLDAYVDIAQRAKNDEDRQAVISKALREVLLQRLTQQGCLLPLDAIDELLRSDIRLNAQGLIHWLDQPTERFKQL